MEINPVAPNAADRERANDSPHRVSPRARNMAGTSTRRPNYISSCSTKMNQRSFANFWSVESFSIQLELHQPGEFMLAPKFGDNEYEFVMKLFPNGKDEETAGYLSLFLLINKCPNPRLRFRVSFTVETADGPRSCHLNKNLVTINRSGIVTASKFFSLDILKSAQSVYTPNDVLTIGCDLTIFGEAQTWTTNLFNHPYTRTGVPKMHCSTSAATNLFSLDQDDEVAKDDGFPELLATGDFSDFTVVSSDGREFQTHMCVLSARSEYFKALLRNKTTQEFEQKRVKFEDISGTVLAILLRHIYTTANTTDQDGVKEHELSPELVTAVDRLMVTSMRSQLAVLLLQNVSIENVVSRLSMAAELRLPETYDNLLQFFAAQKKECMVHSSWSDLRVDKPALTIKILEDVLLSANMSESSVDRRIVDRIIIS